MTVPHWWCGDAITRLLTHGSWQVGHHSDVIMSAMASQITGVSIVCSTVCSGEDQRTPQSSEQGLCVTVLCERNPPATGGSSSQRACNAEMFPFDDVTIQNHQIYNLGKTRSGSSLISLKHLLVTYVCVINLGHKWFRQCLVTFGDCY